MSANDMPQTKDLSIKKAWNPLFRDTMAYQTTLLLAPR